jgi:UDP-N-acetylglucosamine 4-epimerase
VLDNFSTGKRENLAEFASHPAFELIEGDIRNMDDCRRAAENMEYIFHEAALGSVPRSIKDPATSTAVNISGFVNMLFAACEAEVKRFVYASSSSVYGDCQDSPKVESRTGSPLSPYALTKSVNEQFAANFTRVYGMECIGLRYFNVFGKKQDPAGAYAAVIPKFSAALIKHESPVINGDGSFSRDFTYIDNVVQANICAMDAPQEATGKVFNIACGTTTSLNELFMLLRTELAAFDNKILSVEPIYAPVRQGDIPHSLADITLAEKMLGYTPIHSIMDGVKLTAKWYFDHLR